MTERFVKIKSFTKEMFREKLLSFFGKEFVDKIEEEGNIKIDELKKTPFPILDLERLVFRFFYAGTKDEKGNISPLENPSINKLTQQYFTTGIKTKSALKISLENIFT